MVLRDILSIVRVMPNSIVVNGDIVEGKEIQRYYDSPVSGLDCYNNNLVIFVNTNLDNEKILKALNSLSAEFRGDADRYDRGDVEHRVLEVYALLGDDYIRRAIEIAHAGRAYKVGKVGNRLAVNEMLSMLNLDIEGLKASIR